MAEKEEHPQKARVLEGLNFTSDRLSTQVRQISFGILALVWAVFAGEAKINAASITRGLLITAALAVLTMTVDFMQYIEGYFGNLRAWEDLRQGGEGRFQRGWWSQRMRRWSFNTKLALCALNSMLMLYLLGRLIMS